MPTLFHRSIAIRLAGAILLGGAVTCLSAFFHDPAARHGVLSALDGLEAAGGFIGASLGALLLLLGRHIHDRIRISRPWAGAS